ncbi:twin-arginine translocase subunit TatC [Marinoscillum sp. 108]|jgi:sec-independent protein translocase protein TatC|uniref:Sec-independent protein translocase protein TatC n=1 Tax=Marinoscillum luteum TaxID=861051 RepID=A0ABW7N6S2_9BACT|nr:twin-arginine translocase subunit TatC [Marinoscillum sp. 108]VXD17412.1 Sec-independent protein translocase protein TatC [Marinoscillum sp. 108]
MPLDQVEDEEQEMTFLDHLEELRWHLIRSLIAIMVFAIAAFAAKTLVFHTIILGPSRVDFWTYEALCRLSEMLKSPALCIDELPFIIQSRQMTGQFSMHVTSSFVIGIICAFPYAFWEIWRFVKPGLYPKERKAARGATFYVSLLFLMGVFFGYFIVTPISINFLSNYRLDPSIMNEFDIISYVSTVITLILACGILFQLPIVVFFLTKAGLVTPELLKTYRRHAIIVILILGAMLTPPDPFSQILIAIPLLGLYEVSIFISRRVTRRELLETTEIQKRDE